MSPGMGEEDGYDAAQGQAGGGTGEGPADLSAGPAALELERSKSRPPCLAKGTAGWRRLCQWKGPASTMGTQEHELRGGTGRACSSRKERERWLGGSERDSSFSAFTEQPWE